MKQILLIIAVVVVVGCAKQVEPKGPEPLAEHRIEEEARRVYGLVDSDYSRYFKALDTEDKSDAVYYRGEIGKTIMSETRRYTDEDRRSIRDRVMELGEKDNPL